MRKVVCSFCAKDWAIQHHCAFSSSPAMPTVIWEPEESYSHGSGEHLYAPWELLKKVRALLEQDCPMKALRLINEALGEE